jgi:heptosyltransferase-2/heptosyltransferase-3
VLQFLHQRFSKPCIVFGAGPWNSQLYIGHPDVAEALTFTRHFPVVLSFTWWRALRILRRSHPGPVYVFEGNTRQLVRIRRMLRLSGIDPRRCVFIGDEPESGGEHWVDRLVRFAMRVPESITANDFPTPLSGRRGAPNLHVLETERQDMRRWLEAHGWTQKKIVLLQPGNFRSMSKRQERWQRSAADDKSWPRERWIALARKIDAELPGALILLCGAPAEAGMLEQIRTASGLATVRTASLPLRQLLALCEFAHSMVSVDTGPAHAAAALGVPVVVMYGRESPTVWLPRSATGSSVVGIGGPPRSTRVDQIEVEDVLSAPVLRKRP